MSRPDFEQNGVQLWCGDCRDVLPLLEGVDAVVTDPPYGISHSSSHGATWQNTRIAGDSDTSLRDEVCDGFENVSACGTWKTPPIKGVRGCVVWDKGPAFGMGDLEFPWKPSFELVYIRGSAWSGRRDEGVLRGDVVVSWESKGRVHPHEKPVWLMQRFVEKLPFGCTVLDPFMGSGPTGAACIRAGYRFIGIELDRSHFSNALARIQRELAQGVLFRPEPVVAATPELFP